MPRGERVGDGDFGRGEEAARGLVGGAVCVCVGGHGNEGQTSVQCMMASW